MFFKISFILPGIILVIVQMAIIVPYVLKYSPEKYYGKTFGLYEYARLMEYMSLCKAKKKSLFWFYFQISMMIFCMLLFFLS
jgi:hypothetical protein